MKFNQQQQKNMDIQDAPHDQLQIKIQQQELDNHQEKNSTQKLHSTITSHPTTLFRRKQIFHSRFSINHICNIEDTFFINQSSLRNPQHQQQSFLKTIFYFKSISFISVNQNYITLHLKKRHQNYLPKEYFIERFKSFGNKQFYQIAVHLEHIVQHINGIKSINASHEIKQNFTKEKEERILEETLVKLEKKKFFSFFYEFTQQGSSLDQIIISKALLTALGYDYQDIVIDFLKYQQAIFEIISAKLYCLVMQKKSQLLDSIFQRMKQQILQPQQVKQLSMFRFNDYLLQNTSNTNNQYTRKILSRIKFHKAHPSVTIFQVQKMNRKSKIQYNNNYYSQQQHNIKNQQNYQQSEQYKLYKIKQKIKNKQYNCIKHILKVSENKLEENKQKMSSYKLKYPQIKVQNKKKKKKIISQSQDSQYLGFD